MRRTIAATVPSRVRIPIAVAAIAALLGLAACGGDDDDTTTPAASETTGTTETTDGGGTETVDIDATDFAFTPDNPKVKAGRVTFALANDGQTIHNIAVEGPNGEQEIPNDIAAGESGRVTVDLSEPGTYEFYCPVGNHRDLGMVGEVEVQ